MSLARFHEQLARLGIGLALDLVGNDTAVRNLVDHPEPLIGKLFEQSLHRLSRLTLRTLEYAAFLPADLVPVAWLEALVKADADMAETIGSPPWRAAATGGAGAGRGRRRPRGRRSWRQRTRRRWRGRR